MAASTHQKAQSAGREYLESVVLGFLVLWLAFFLLRKIDLTTQDLGRHLKNGETVLHDRRLLTSNFYSYTHPEFPVVNHHWGSGLIFYGVHRSFGFPGLSIFYAVMILAAFSLFWKLARSQVDWAPCALAALALIPLIAERREVRPEGFSYLLTAIFCWTLWQWQAGRLRRHWLTALPLLEIFWVNTHIYFVFGPIVIGAFLLNSLIMKRPDQVRILIIVLGAALLASVVSPLGWSGAIYPLNIFRNYGYKIIENQSVWFLWRRLPSPGLYWFVAVFTALTVTTALAWPKFRERPWAFLFLSGISGIMAWLGIRNFTIFALLSLPLLASNLKWIPAFAGMTPRNKTRVAIVAALIIAGAVVVHRRGLAWASFGAGTYKGNHLAASFIKALGVPGPIFNNYDIGSYLIYHLFPKERIFVDNRPEAYPETFFTSDYIPIQEKREAWQEANRRYGFNLIAFAWHDATPWGQQFLIERVQDPEWAPIFVDSFALVLIKRLPGFKPIIDRFEIPKSRFSVARPPRKG